MTLAISAGLLVCGAVYLLQRRELLRVILGFVLLGHAVNLILMAAGGSSARLAPFGTFDDTTGVGDPLPQAFVLTAIVIAFSITIFLLALAVTGDDDDDTAAGRRDGGARTDPLRSARRRFGRGRSEGARTEAERADVEPPDAADADADADSADSESTVSADTEEAGR
ncbi:sodium:proton antiporter [Labedella endophytica]|jgi:multicomponent Na+:H+ antiporter subunit C|uniref:Cation:proton antiporter n=1 Tax=Labedella endophytica TaxID=1523160 RepID=A0A3S0XJH6_9MICO|nr:cation:proton antiporter subunit C [Labedella endophytica]RUQ96894.1 cation:proton antiporter [Labedella endophytica]